MRCEHDELLHRKVGEENPEVFGLVLALQLGLWASHSVAQELVKMLTHVSFNLKSLPSYPPPNPFGSSQCKSSCNLCLLSVKAKNRGVQMLLGALLPFPVGGSHPEDFQGSPGSSRYKWLRFSQMWVQSLALTLCLLTMVTSVVTKLLWALNINVILWVITAGHERPFNKEHFAFNERPFNKEHCAFT